MKLFESIKVLLQNRKFRKQVRKLAEGDHHNLYLTHIVKQHDDHYHIRMVCSGCGKLGIINFAPKGWLSYIGVPDEILAEPAKLKDRIKINI